jgi:ComF family protein
MYDMSVQANTGQASSSGLVWLKKIGNAAVDLLFPPRCVNCQRLGAWLCAGCLDEIEVILPPICHRCGSPLHDHEGTSNLAEKSGLFRCDRCRTQTSPLDGRCAYAFHAGPLREAIHQLKYEDLRALAVPLGRLMARGWDRLRPPNGNVDVIVPIPLHPTRQRQRGYNQAALLARELGSALGLVVAEDVLIRIKATAPQVELDAAGRRANVRNAFRTVDGRLAGKRVLIVDDVATTGSTLEAAADALRDGKASYVWAYTLARAR